MHRAIQTAFIALLLLASPAMAGNMDSLDTTMKDIAAEMLIIDKALAADSSEGVQKAAAAIKALSDKIETADLTGKDADKLKGIEGKIGPAAQKMAEAKTIEEQRAILKDLSKPVALWATIRQPDGLYVAYCPMAPGSWIQDEKMISNPYYGASMLRCGEIAERSDGKDHKD